jgi:oligopeptide transport system substrate-binding protein
VLDPETAAEYAYQLYGIKGAEEYNQCEDNCAQLRDEVGVEAVDERTLRVTLTSAQPWFPQVVAHHIFLAVPQEIVEQHGRNWTEPQNIVTNGPYQLTTWEHESRLDLTKWDEWRAADEVTLTRVNGRIITEGTTALQAFEAGEVDLLDPGLIPTAEVQRLKDTPEWYASPSLATYFYGFNTENVPDVNQRRAMSLAIDRRTIVDRITQAGEEPATGFTPAGMAGFDVINPQSEWLPENGDLERANQLMEQVENPDRDITLIFNNSPGHREIAVAIQGMWKEIGITTTLRQQEWAQFLEFIGPPPNKSVDVYRLGWLYDYPDALNGLEMWTCESGNNSTNWCNEEYDRMLADARATPEDEERYEKYADLEAILVGEEGELPIVPIYWYTNTTLVNESLRDSFSLNPQGFIEFMDLEVAG